MSPLLATLSLALAWTPAASEDTARPGISWRAPAQCPTAEQVGQRVDERIGPLPPDAPQGDAAVREDGRGGLEMRVSLRVDGVWSTRAVESDDCSTLADAYVLMLAVAMGRDAGEPAPPEPAPPSGRDSELAAEVGAAAFGEVGVLPRLTGGPTIHGALLGGRWEVGVGVAHALPRRVELDDGASLSLQRWSAALWGGPALRRPWGDLSLDAGVEGGGFVGRTRGSAAIARRHVPWLSARASGRGGFAVSPRVSVFVRATVLVGITRVRYRHEDTDELFTRTGRFGGRVSLGVTIRFPPR